jgi:hypothetical protein
MISRERVLIFLREKQESDGGYSGNDLTKLAELLMVTPFGLRAYPKSPDALNVINAHARCNNAR